jgi:hypothetical protein
VVDGDDNFCNAIDVKDGFGETLDEPEEKEDFKLKEDDLGKVIEELFADGRVLVG